MTTGAKVYNSIIMSLSALCLVTMASIWFVIVPKAEDPGPFYFVLTVWAILLVVFAGTSLFNFARGKLVLIPTVLQIIFTLWSVVGIPVGIWGIVLLVQQRKGRKCQQQDGQVSSESALSDEPSS